MTFYRAHIPSAVMAGGAERTALTGAQTASAAPLFGRPVQRAVRRHLHLRLLDKLKQETRCGFRLLLLHPMPGVLNEMDAQHARARRRLHLFEIARSLIDAPVFSPRDET